MGERISGRKKGGKFEPFKGGRDSMGKIGLIKWKRGI